MLNSLSRSKLASTFIFILGGICNTEVKVSGTDARSIKRNTKLYEENRHTHSYSFPGVDVPILFFMHRSSCGKMWQNTQCGNAVPRNSVSHSKV